MHQAERPIPSPRLHFLDEMRGFAVLCMVFFHAFYTMSESFDMSIGAQLLNFFMPAEVYFAGFFILLSGFSCRLSRSNAKRGGILLCIALALTGTTLLLDRLGMPGVLIWFGILHLLSLCMLSFALLRPLLNRIHPVVGGVVCAALFVLFYPISEGSIGLPRLFSIKMPALFYQTDWLAAFGMYSPRFFSADYFPLLPWMFLFFAGSFLGIAAEKQRCPRFFYRLHLPPLAFVGRHALIVYIAHQPAIFVLFWALNPLLIH